MFNYKRKSVLASVCGLFISPLALLGVNCMHVNKTAPTVKVKTVMLDYYYNNEWKKNAEGKEYRWHYTWDDTTFGGYSVLGDIFKKEGAVTASLDAKPTAANLKNASVYIIVDPDTEKETAKPNFMDDEAAGAIADWVKKGGVLVLLTNDAGNAELKNFNKLPEKFGIHFNEDSHNRVQNDQFEQGAVMTPEGHEIFKSAKKLYVKEYSSLNVTSPAKTVLKSGDNNLMAVAKYGKGTVFALGDPWIYNEYVGGKKMPADFVNHAAAEEFVKWLLKQSKKINNKIMIKKILSFGFLMGFALSALAQKPATFFPDKELTTIGAYYYPEHWDESQWDRDFKKMASMGFEFTHFAEFAWAQLEPEEGRYDFAWLDRAVALAAKYNLKVIMCTSTATPPVWLSRKYPEILKKREDGTVMDHGSRQHASFSSEVYRTYSMKMIAKLAKHYGKDSRIMGWQLDNEPASNVDYGNDAQNRFRIWLKDKYKTIDALNKAWGTNFWSGTYTDFKQINLPQHKQWGMNLYQQLDHSRFCDAETANFLDESAKVIRQYSTPKQWITSNYIPNYDARYIGNSKELDFVTYTRYMVYGEHDGIGAKGYRVGEYSRIAMANDYFRPISPLYGVMELQPGQVNWGTINSQPLPGAVRLWLWHVFAGGSKLTCTYRFRAPIYGFEQYHAGILGTDGVTPTSGGLEFEQYIKEIQLLRKNQNTGKVPADYLKRKTAILYDADNTVAINQNKQTTVWDTDAHVLKYYKTLKGFGAPVDFIRESMDLAKYPVVVVPAYQQMSKGLIAKLEKYARDGGNLVLSCRTGHQDEQGHLWEARHAAPIYPLIGAEIEFYDLLKPHAPDTITMEGKNFTWTSWGDVLKPMGATKTWATYSGDFYAGKPAVTFTKLGKGTVTYVGADSNTGDLEQAVLTKLYKQLQIPIENYPPGVTVEYRDGFGIAMNYSDKPYEMKVPAGAEILIGQATIKTAGVLVWKIKN